MTASQTPTPGYNRRLAIFFTTNARGQRAAYRWSPLQFRAFRIPLADAEIMRATETADILPCHPMRPPACECCKTYLLARDSKPCSSCGHWFEPAAH